MNQKVKRESRFFRYVLKDPLIDSLNPRQVSHSRDRYQKFTNLKLKRN